MNVIFYDSKRVEQALDRLTSYNDLAEVLCEAAVGCDKRAGRGGPIERDESMKSALRRIAAILNRTERQDRQDIYTHPAPVAQVSPAQIAQVDAAQIAQVAAAQIAQVAAAQIAQVPCVLG